MPEATPWGGDYKDSMVSASNEWVESMNEQHKKLCWTNSSQAFYFNTNQTIVWNE